MVRTEEELEKLKIQIKEAEIEYNRILNAGFKKHEECCPDVCSVINEAIDKLNKNLTKAEELRNTISKQSITRKHQFASVMLSLPKKMNATKLQLKELEDIRDDLYAKGTCNCRK